MAASKIIVLSEYEVRAAKKMLGILPAYEVRDIQVPGFCLRVGKTSMTWAYRDRYAGSQTTWRIGDGAKLSVVDARERAAKARSMLRQTPPQNPKQMLVESEHGAAPLVPQQEPEVPGWTWEQARDAYLESIVATRRTSTIIDYRNTLRHPDLAILCGRKVASITARDAYQVEQATLARCRVEAEQSGGKIIGIPGARKSAVNVIILRSCLKWASLQADSGLEHGVSPVASAAPSNLGSKAKGARRGRVPTPEELGQAAWTLAGANGPSLAKLAGAIVLFTGLRIRTVLEAHKAEFEPSPYGGIWKIPASNTKLSREHLVPLPPVLWHVVRTAISLSGDGPRLFPITKVRRAGSCFEGHIAYGTVRDALGANVKPHDCRRAIVTHGMGILRWPLIETKGIVDHGEGREGDITLERYMLGDGQYYKWRLMREWEAWMLEQIAAAAPPGGPVCPIFLTPDIAKLTSPEPVSLVGVRGGRPAGIFPGPLVS